MEELSKQSLSLLIEPVLQRFFDHMQKRILHSLKSAVLHSGDLEVS